MAVLKDWRQKKHLMKKLALETKNKPYGFSFMPSKEDIERVKYEKRMIKEKELTEEIEVKSFMKRLGID